MAGKRGTQEKGQARIQQLLEMFPEKPRTQVIRTDAILNGIRSTPALKEIGRWALPDIYDHYTYSYEFPSEDARAVENRTPKHLYFRDRTGLAVMLSSNSPYDIRYEGRGSYRLYRDDEPIEEVLFPPRPQWHAKTTSSGKLMGDVIALQEEGRLLLYNTTYCEYFKDGSQCIFCNLNTTGQHFTEVGEERTPVSREQDVYETYLAAGLEKAVEVISVCTGGFYNRSKEADLGIRNVRVLKRAMEESGWALPIAFISQAMEEEDYLRIKEAGATSVNHPMEVWDPKLFPIICPGKSKNIGREHFIDLLLKAVEIFGWGKVITNFVVGVEMVPPFGFKTEEEASESLLEGCQFWASHGVVMVNTPFRVVPGTAISQSPRPRTEYIIRMEIERDKLLTEYNLLRPAR